MLHEVCSLVSSVFSDLFLCEPRTANVFMFVQKNLYQLLLLAGSKEGNVNVDKPSLGIGHAPHVFKLFENDFNSGAHGLSP